MQSPQKPLRAGPEKPLRAGAPAGSVLADYRKFVARAVRKPGLVGAVAPSSSHLAHEMAAVVPRSSAAARSVVAAAPEAASDSPVVVELGPGTGALSRAVHDRLPSGGRHVAIELDPGMVEHLRAELPWLEVVQGDAAGLGALLADAGIEAVDAVISGLPWSIFSAGLQRDILTGVGQVLAPGGAFTTFAYLHALGMSGARNFRQRLDGAFDEVLTSRTVWRNVPPARIYTCRRPVS